MKVTAKATFIRGQYRLRRGETGDLPVAVAKDLIAAGMATEAADEKKASASEVKQADKPASKATDAKG